MPYPQTKQRLFELLRAGHRVSVHWDCGHDEALTYTSIDGQLADPADEFAYEVDCLLVEQLDLPSASEFSVTGDGVFFLEGRTVGLEYTSATDEEELPAAFYDSFTEDELAEMGLKRPAPQPDTPASVVVAETPLPEGYRVSNEYSGRRILFELPA